MMRLKEHARKLLHEPGVTVFEAAGHSGFSDQSLFAKIFRRVVVVTPTGYRAAVVSSELAC